MIARLFGRAMVMALLVFVIVPIRMGSQPPKPQHHRYKLVDLGSLGGTNSSLNAGDAPFFPPAQVLNRSGAAAAIGDTTMTDPFCFIGLYGGAADCSVVYTMRWEHGVQTNLGALPANSMPGPQTACLNCAWDSYAFSINDAGAIAGFSLNGEADLALGVPEFIAALWKDGKIINLGTLGGNQSAALGLNNRGDVVGAALNTTPELFPLRAFYSLGDPFLGNATEFRATLWRDGKIQDLGTLGGGDSNAYFINDRGQIAGASDVDANFNPVTGSPTVHPFLWDGGKMRDLIADAPPGMFGGTYGITTWMNNRGQVTGTMNLTGDLTWHSFFWDHGVVRDLGTLGGIHTTATWMNDAGHIVGYSDVTALCVACTDKTSQNKQLHHPFLWIDGKMTDLALLYADTGSTPRSINSKDQIVGGSGQCLTINVDDSCNDVVGHHWLWENGSLADLETLILPGSDFTIVSIIQINDRGEIAATGNLPNGDHHALLLIPCDDDHPGIKECEQDDDDRGKFARAGAASAPQPSHAKTKTGGGVAGFGPRREG
jgi:uncharacterized membrane protein